MTRSRHSRVVKRASILAPGIVIPLLILLIFTKSPITIDGSTPNIHLSQFTDTSSHGHSTIDICSLTEKGSLDLQFTLHDSTETPYAGAGFFFEDTTHLINLEEYQSLTLTLDPDKSTNMDITLHFYIPGYSDLQDGITQYYLMCDIFVEPGKHSYTIPFSSLYTPSWWYQHNKISRSELPEPVFATFSGVSFDNHPLLEKGMRHSISIESVKFTKGNRNAFIFAGLFFALYFSGILVVFMFKKSGSIFIPYEKLSLKEPTSDLERLIRFINSNYHREELCQTMVARETGFHSKQIRSLITETYGKSFKEYVTSLRMAEARRLILSTNHKIYRIAESVGYTHTSTFNHVFKNHEGVSPIQFKKMHGSGVKVRKMSAQAS